jgi:hypothetical protein
MGVLLALFFVLLHAPGFVIFRRFLSLERSAPLCLDPA